MLDVKHVLAIWLHLENCVNEDFFFPFPLMSCTSWQISHCSHFSTCSDRQKCDSVSRAYRSHHCCMCRPFPKKEEGAAKKEKNKTKKKNIRAKKRLRRDSESLHKNEMAVPHWATRAGQSAAELFALHYPRTVVPPAAVSAFSQRTCGKRKWMHRVSRSSQRVSVTRSQQSGNYSSRELFVSNRG